MLKGIKWYTHAQETSGLTEQWEQLRQQQAILWKL